MQCESGRADLDADSTTGCALCDVGTYVDVGSIDCVVCAAGHIDDDHNASTACVLGTNVLQASVTLTTDISTIQADTQERTNFEGLFRAYLAASLA